MRHAPRHTPRPAGDRTAVAAFLLAAASLVAPLPASAQSDEPVSPKELVKAAHDRQHDFEVFRQSRIPVAMERRDGHCDQQIGRICIWFGGPEEENFPAERPEVGLARRELIGVLYRAAEQVADPWVFGQLVHYLAQNKDLGQAERVARGCGLEDGWWCSALLGYVLHLEGQWVASETAFREALATMPKKERERWPGPRYIIPRGDEKAFNRGDAQEKQRRWELFWKLSDPLYLVEGNDRLTDHFARWVEATNERDAENPQGMLWDEDMEETLVRYGRLRGYSRTQAPQRQMRGLRFSLQDTRQVIGHHAPMSRGYLFPSEFLASPSEIPPESWLTAPREARTWYAPPYAPDFRALESQVGRFRRGDEMLVVGAYRPDPVVPADMAPAEEPPAPSFASDGPHDVRSGLFLVPVDEGGTAAEVKGTDTEGVFTLHAAPGHYVSSLEVFDSADARAWRARQGVRQDPLVPGLVAVSDLLVLEEGATLPSTLEEAIPHVRKGVRIRRGERFTVVWEVYGLRVQETAQVSLGFTEGRPGFRGKVGDFLGELEPDRPVQVAFQDTGAEGVQTVFRSVFLELPTELEPGDYTLHLRLELPGREPAIVSRPIVVQ